MLVGAIVATVVYIALVIFILLMWVRFILDLASSIARSWRPHGFMLVVAEFAYFVTDPPVRVVRKIVPPLRVGGVALDLAWSIVLLVAIIVSTIIERFSFV